MNLKAIFLITILLSSFLAISCDNAKNLKPNQHQIKIENKDWWAYTNEVAFYDADGKWIYSENKWSGGGKDKVFIIPQLTNVYSIKVFTTESTSNHWAVHNITLNVPGQWPTYMNFISDYDWDKNTKLTGNGYTVSSDGGYKEVFVNYNL